MKKPYTSISELYICIIPGYGCHLTATVTRVREICQGTRLSPAYAIVLNSIFWKNQPEKSRRKVECSKVGKFTFNELSTAQLQWVLPNILRSCLLWTTCSYSDIQCFAKDWRFLIVLTTWKMRQSLACSFLTLFSQNFLV